MPYWPGPTTLAGKVRPRPLEPSLAYGQTVDQTGFHVMARSGRNWVESLTGLGACGVEVLLAFVADHPRQGHPLVPLVQVTSAGAMTPEVAADVALVLSGSPDTWPVQIFTLLGEVMTGHLTPGLVVRENVDFQISRGLLGVSL